MSVITRNYLMTRIEELQEQKNQQEAAFVTAQRNVFQLAGAIQALTLVLQELQTEEVTEPELAERLGAESVEFVPVVEDQDEAEV